MALLESCRNNHLLITTMIESRPALAFAQIERAIDNQRLQSSIGRHLTKQRLSMIPQRLLPRHPFELLPGPAQLLQQQRLHIPVTAWGGDGGVKNGPAHVQDARVRWLA
uniref:Uncharacterized protein n=1 Tax=Coccolithus braarudii TaxID=221442 RepID=A0A7S0Q0K2_9EUKA